MDTKGNLYISDSLNYRIREVLASGIVNTVAGNGTPFNADGVYPPAGPATAFTLYDPTAITVRTDGTVFFTDFSIIDALSPSGTITPDLLNSANDLAADTEGNVYGIAVTGTNVFMYAPGAPAVSIAGNPTNPNAGIKTTGDGGPATAATFVNITAIAVDSSGNIYVADSGDGVIRKFKLGGSISTVAGIPGFNTSGNTPPLNFGNGGQATQAVMNIPPLNGSIAVDGLGNLYVIDLFTNQVRIINSMGVISAYAGNGSTGKYFGNGGPALQAVIVPDYIAADATGDLYIAHSAGNQQSGYQELILKVAVPVPVQTGAPVISAIASSAGDLISVTPGGFATIYGTNLSGTTRGWMTSDFVGNLLPTMLSGVSVTVDSKPAYVNYISPGQINILVPDDTTVGPVNVVVTNSSGVSAAFSVPMVAYAPAFFTIDGTHVVAQHLDYSLVAATGFAPNSRPASPGETIILYGTGFGPTSPATPSNMLVTTPAQIVSTNPLSISIGGANAPSSFAGIIESGLYQINVTIPQTAASGDQTIAATLGTVTTQSGTVIPIQ